MNFNMLQTMSAAATSDYKFTDIGSKIIYSLTSSEPPSSLSLVKFCPPDSLMLSGLPLVHSNRNLLEFANRCSLIKVPQRFCPQLFLLLGTGFHFKILLHSYLLLLHVSLQHLGPLGT